MALAQYRFRDGTDTFANRSNRRTELANHEGRTIAKSCNRRANAALQLRSTRSLRSEFCRCYEAFATRNLGRSDLEGHDGLTIALRNTQTMLLRLEHHAHEVPRAAVGKGCLRQRTDLALVVAVLRRSGRLRQGGRR